MIQIVCEHSEFKKHGTDRDGNPRFRCKNCGKTWIVPKAKPLGKMLVSVEDAKLVLNLLTQGMSIRAAERITGIQRNTICKLVVLFGEKCRAFLDSQMQGLKLDHVEVDEQWTFVRKKQARLTIEEREKTAEIGDMYLWLGIDQKTKLIPCFRLGKRSADNARRFMVDLAQRLVRPNPHASDAHGWTPGGYTPIVQISTDGFAAYPEAVDLAFGPLAKFGTIIKQYRNARLDYTPSEMVGTKREGIRGIDRRNVNSICTSHVERFNCTTRMFMKRFCRLTLCFSKKLENLEAAVAMYVAYYNYCWQTRKSGKSGQKRGTAAMMAGLAGHVWSFDELFQAVLAR